MHVLGGNLLSYNIKTLHFFLKKNIYIYNYISLKKKKKNTKNIHVLDN